uniref:Uncharacterized protein n=1 Tax=Dechloromonas aromatica (strain RCB) TaxID=159087 RepID=Q47HV3_DECAR
MVKLSLVGVFVALSCISSGVNAVQPSVEERLTSCDPSIAVAAADEFVGNPSNSHDEGQLFTVAKIYLENKREDDAVFWYFAAKLRLIHFIAGDENNQKYTMMLGWGSGILEPHIKIHALKDLNKLRDTTDHLITWNDKTYDQYKKHNSVKAAKLEADLQQMFIKLEREQREYGMAAKVFSSRVPEAAKQAWDAALKIGYGSSVSIYPGFEGLQKLSTSTNTVLENEARLAATVSENVFFGLRANCQDPKTGR